jgi:hypothetical protein
VYVHVHVCACAHMYVCMYVRVSVPMSKTCEYVGTYTQAMTQQNTTL